MDDESDVKILAGWKKLKGWAKGTELKVQLGGIQDSDGKISRI